MIKARVGSFKFVPYSEKTPRPNSSLLATLNLDEINKQPLRYFHMQYGPLACSGTFSKLRMRFCLHGTNLSTVNFHLAGLQAQ
jgi:hypothetical protein